MCAPTSWSASTAYVIGSTLLIACSQPAIWSRATNSPQRSICGRTTTGMNCTAWNSVRANALQNRPSATPSTALAIAIRMTSPTLPLVFRSRRVRHPAGDRGLDRGGETERDAVREQQVSLPIGVVSSRSSVPEVRSRSIAMLVIRNMITNGKIAEHDQADAVERAAGGVLRNMK